MDSTIWSQKESLANEPWLVEESGEFVLNRLYGGSVYASLGFTITLPFLLLLSWSWRFLLARIRELSDAVRGKCVQNNKAGGSR